MVVIVFFNTSLVQQNSTLHSSASHISPISPLKGVDPPKGLQEPLTLETVIQLS